MVESLCLLVGVMSSVRDAVLVAGGLGTRMFPVSASVAKEALPLVDVTAMSHLALEAIAAGATRLHIISRPGKDLSGVLADHSWLANKRPEVSPTHLNPYQNVEVFVHEQTEALGLGDAIGRSLHAIDGPFLVLLGDNILLDSHVGTDQISPSNASRILVEKYESTSLPCVGLCQVEQVENYGVVEMSGERVVRVVEKPNRQDAPSNLVLCGRYLFTEDTAELLKHYDVETYGELQSIQIQKHWMENDGLVGVELTGYQWYDAGAPMPWLQAQIDHALRRDDMKDELREWLNERLAE